MDKIFDIVIVGSGLGGLACGYILSQEGYNVCILEKNRQIGGSLQIFSRDKVIFDTGIHYIGGLSKGENLYQYFKYFGLMDKLQLLRLDVDGYDVVSFKGDNRFYKHAQGYDNFIRVLSEEFPEDTENIKNYVQKIREIADFFPLYNVSDEKKDLTLAKFLETDAKTYIESVTPNKRLQAVLAGTNPLYAGEANMTPLYIHALVVNSYMESAYRCVDGGAQIARHLSSAIKSKGGVIRNYSEACKFHFQDDLITEVELTNGERIKGKQFISNVDLQRTLQMAEGGPIRQAYKSRINSLENTISTFILYITLEKKSMKYFNHNIYHYLTDNVWESIHYKEENWPQSFAAFTQASSKDAEYADSLIVMTYMRYEEMEKWKDSFYTIPNNNSNRGEGYEEFKRQKSEKLIDVVEERLPGLRSKIKSYYSSTPLTYRDYIGSSDGTIYGIKKDFRNPLKTFITPKTKIGNLLLTGQNLNCHGVLGVTVSAVVTCSELLGTSYLIQKIKAAQ